MRFGYCKASTSMLLAMAAILTVSFVLSTNAAQIVPASCMVGSEFVQVVAFVTIKSEELIRMGGTYTGLDARSSESTDSDQTKKPLAQVLD
jgi:tRNA G37 N-methylase TrmD